MCSTRTCLVATALALAPIVAAADPAPAPVPNPVALASTPANKLQATPRTVATPDRAALQRIAEREAKLAGLPFSLVDTVIKIESDYRPDRVGDVGEIGLMQVRPTTAAMMGFQGSSLDLAEPSTNIHYGATYLGEAWRLAKGNVCRTLMKYRAGHGNETMSPLSVTYCERARSHLASIGSPLAATITPVDLVSVAVASVPGEVVRPIERTKSAESLMINGRPKTGQAFWTAFQARIRRINAGLEAKWKQTAAQ